MKATGTGMYEYDFYILRIRKQRKQSSKYYMKIKIIRV
jgi:hypothetical protein